MTTLSSLSIASSLGATTPSNTADGLPSTTGVESKDAVAGSPSTIVTIPSMSVEPLTVYTPQGTIDGAASTVTWAQSNTDAVSLVMAADYTANSISGQFQNLGSALLDRFETTGSDFSQSVTVGSAGAAGAIGQSAQGMQGDIKLTVQTASGVEVDLEIDSGNGTLAVSVKGSGTLNVAERNALAGLADGFQKAIDGLGAVPPKLDLSGLMQYDTSALSSVNMQFNVTGGLLGNVSADFSANRSSRSVSLSDGSGRMNLTVDTKNSALLGSGAQGDQAIASYLKQFDNANTEGHGNAEMMTLFKDAFVQLNSDNGTSSQQPAGSADRSWLAQSEQSMLTGLPDFSGSITDSPDTIGETGEFSYQVSQSTTTEGDLQNGTIVQTQESHLEANYREALSSGSRSYDDVQIGDDASSTIELETEQGILRQASLSQSSSQTSRSSEYVGGTLVSDVTTPTNSSDSKDLLAMLKPLIDDGQAAQDSGTWQQALSAIHGMILLNASAN